MGLMNGYGEASMGNDAPKSGRYRLGSAFIWAAAQGALAWQYGGKLAWLAGGFGGLAAGWCTAALLGRFAKWGAGYKIMMALGVIAGVVISSGAVTGLGRIFSLIGLAKAPEVNWQDLGKFLLSTAALPAAALGLLTGIYVRSKIPRPDVP